MSEPLVSIIIPIYNVENYIEKCLNSVLNQTYKTFECLLIDDGSPDNSIKIAKEIVENDSRFKIYSKKNGGLGSARNYGIERVSGDYISFLDSDDWMEKDMIELLVSAALKKQADIVFCSINVRDEKGSLQEIVWEGNNLPDDYYAKNYPETIYEIGSYAPNKLYKTNLFLDSNIRFPTGMFYEDIATFGKLFLESSKIAKIQKPLYNYLFGRQSISTSYKYKNFKDFFKASSIIVDYVNKKNIPNKVDLTKKFKILTSFYLPGAYAYYIKPNKNRIKAIKYICENLKNENISYLEVITFRKNDSYYLVSKGILKSIYFLLLLFFPRFLYFSLGIHK